MKRALPYVLAFLCTAFPVLSASAQTMSHEEEVVRNAYAKLSLMCSLPPLTKAGNMQLSGLKVDPDTLDKEIANATPTFQITSVRTGLIADIANAKWGNFVIAPNGRILRGSAVNYDYVDNGNQTKWKMAQVQWSGKEEDNPEADKIVLGLPISEIIKLDSQYWTGGFPAVALPVTYTRYAAFTVNATFQGKFSGPHKGIFFFGRDARGNEFVADNDLISGQNSLWDALNYRGDDISGILRGKIRETPVVADWLRKNVMPAASCSAKSHVICCSGGHCGISPLEFNRTLSIPLPAPKGN